MKFGNVNRRFFEAIKLGNVWLIYSANFLLSLAVCFTSEVEKDEFGTIKNKSIQDLSKRGVSVVLGQENFHLRHQFQPRVQSQTVSVSLVCPPIMRIVLLRDCST